MTQSCELQNQNDKLKDAEMLHRCGSAIMSDSLFKVFDSLFALEVIEFGRTHCLRSFHWMVQNQQLKPVLSLTFENAENNHIKKKEKRPHKYMPVHSPIKSLSLSLSVFLSLSQPPLCFMFLH